MPKLERKRTEVFKSGDGWRYRKIAGNGRVEGAAEEGVKQKQYGVLKAIKNSPDRPVYVFNEDGTVDKVTYELTRVK